TPASVFDGMATAIEGALAEEPVPGLDEIAARVAAAAQELSGEDGPARVAPPAWAAALHNPALATTVRGILGPLRAGWVKAARRMREDGRLPPGADVDAAGAVLFALLPGFLLQHLILGDTDAATFQRGLRQLRRPQLLSSGYTDALLRRTPHPHPLRH